MYLGLGVDSPSSRATNQRTVLWIPDNNQRIALLRDYHPLSCCIPADFGLHALAESGPRHHISCRLLYRIRFALFRFRSPLLTESRLLSPPSGTKMLQFPEYPIVANEFGNPRFYGCMRLAWAYRS